MSTKNDNTINTNQQDTLNSGTSGDDTITVLPDVSNQGGEGADRYIFREWGKNMHIDDFNPLQGDVLDLSEFGLSRDEVASRITNINVEADNLIVNFGDDVKITLANVKADEISWDDVICADDHGGSNPGSGRDRDRDRDHKDDDKGGSNPDRGHKDDDHHKGGSNPDRGHKDDDHHKGGSNPGGGHKDDDHHKGGSNPGGGHKDDDHHKGGSNPDHKDGHGEGGQGQGGGGHGGQGQGGQGQGGHGQGGEGQGGGGQGRHHDSDGHKHFDCRPGEHVRGETGADNFAFHDLGHWRIDGFNGREGDVLDFSGYGMSQEEIARHITNIEIDADNFIVNFGDDVSITLIGVKADEIGWDNVDVGA